MKRIVFVLFAVLFCGAAIARSINWYVDGQLYQTTTCASGEDVVPPTPPAKHGYTFQKWKAVYTRVEYLESTGTQYINTGINASNTISMEVKGSDFDATGAQIIVADQAGINANIQGFRIVKLTSSSKLSGCKNNACAQSNLDAVDEFIARLSPSGFFVNGNFVNSLPTVVSGVGQIRMFAGVYAGTYYYSSGKIYYCQIYDNGVLVRDMIPVLDSDGIPCMYDMVSGEFFYNAGTGDFVAGSVIYQ